MVNSLTTTTYSYDKTNVHLFPTKVEVTTSLSTEKIKREFTYVADGSSTGVTGAMKNLNMTGLPLESWTFLVRNGTDYVTDYQKTEYFEWSTNKVYAKSFYGSKIPSGLLRSTFEADPASYTRLTARINSYAEGGIAAETEVVGDRPKSVIVDKNFNRVVASANAASADQIAYTSFESNDFGNWKVATGTTSTTVYDELNHGYTHSTIDLQTTQTINYTWAVTQSNGPGLHLIFSQGASTIDKYLSGSTGGGSVSLTPGTWDVDLTYDINVTSVNVDFSYQQVSQNPPSIISASSKTGRRSLQLGASQAVYKDGLPSGNYTVVFYQKGGTATLATTGGASVLNTVTSAAEADGWTKVQKEIAISGLLQRIELTGTETIYIDELRLYPVGSFMTTTCFDLHKNVITQTDVNLRSQFMEYDEWRRVKIIKDHDKNILQHYDYKLAIH